MFSIITQKHEKKIQKLISTIKSSDISDIASGLAKIIEKIRMDIPEKKRISYGRYSIIKKMGLSMYPLLCEKGVEIYGFVSEMFDNPKHDPFVRSLSIQLLTIHGAKSGELENVLTLLEKAAMDNDWEVRECSAGFVRKLIKKYPDAMLTWYLKIVGSENPMQRRFACESIRPVADNGWFKKNPDFAHSIIKHLYKESDVYPRTSIGNSLSDWMRIDEKRTLKTVRKLVSSGNKNSYWIAYRACRNLVKREPLLVMDILKTDQYIYKDRKFYRKDFQK